MISCTRRRFLLSGAAAVPATALFSVIDDLLLPGRAAAAALPDVVITDVAGPSPITAGQLVIFEATVYNQGAAATPDYVELGVAFRVDGVQVGWNATNHSSLDAGSSITLQANNGGTAGTGAWVATEGTHTVEALVNPSHRFAVASTTGSTRTATFTVAAAVTRPVNTALPVITGTPRVGDVLTVSTGTWS